MIEDVQGAVKALEEVFVDQDNFFKLQGKVREKQRKVKTAEEIKRLVDIYSFDFEEYRIINSFLMGMTEDEIKRLYLRQRCVGRENEATEEGFRKIVEGLIVEGWLKRVDGKIEIDYDFIDCLEEIDRG